MADQDKTAILIILDRSGSMAYPKGFREDMEGGMNTFITEQAKLPGKCRATVVQFDDKYEEVVVDAKLKDVPTIEIMPRGGTALLDAMGKSITNLRDHINSMPRAKRPAKIIVAIVTDGQENSSREWNKGKVSTLVKDLTDKGWEFTYLGANQDAIAEATSLGIRTANAVTYTSKGATSTLSSFTNNASAYRSGIASDVSYSAAQRVAAVDGYEDGSN